MMRLLSNIFENIKGFHPYSTSLIILSSFVFLSACNRADSVENVDNEPVEKSSNKYAKGFQIIEKDDYKIIAIINNTLATPDTSRFILLKKEQEIPKEAENLEVIRIPLEHIATTSSTHIGLIDQLESSDKIVAIGNKNYVYSSKIQQAISEGKTIEIGQDQDLQIEKIITLQPDLLIETGNPETLNSKFQHLKSAHIPVLLNTDWTESHPLARAEWIKLFGVLLGLENKAAHAFAFTENQYNYFQKLVADSTQNRPSVITGNKLNDLWFVPGGKNYNTQLIKDAGASYHWMDTHEKGSITLSFEAMFPIALEADYWINMYTFGAEDSKSALGGMDPRYQNFKAYQSGKLFTFSKRIGANGANDYWESGAIRPDLILGDLVKIFHPELLPNYSLYYYEQLK